MGHYVVRRGFITLPVWENHVSLAYFCAPIEYGIRIADKPRCETDWKRHRQHGSFGILTVGKLNSNPTGSVGLDGRSHSCYRYTVATTTWSER